MKQNKRLAEFFKERPAINLSVIEKECGMPQSTMLKFKQGVRDIPPHWGPVLDKVLRKYGLSGKALDLN